METESESPAGPLRVLIIDDEASIRKMLGLALHVEGHDVKAVGTAAEALDAAEAIPYDLALLDLRLGTDSGMDLLPVLRDRFPLMSIVVITAHGTVENAVEAMRLGAVDFLSKPFTPDQVTMVANRTARMRSLEQRVEELELQVGPAVHGSLDPDSTRSAAMRRALETAARVAATDATILIRGESGTGKTVLARAIHQASRRAAKPFGVVSCPSLPEQLLEGELFGHTRGAFTGAVRSNPGRIAAANGGTLFLDEIGDMPLGLQSKLLRFVQDKEYESLGESATRRADVRLIAATNVDLDQAVREGRFREDLYYRLNVIEVDLPSLRDRREDIMPLAEQLLAQLGREHGRRMAGFDDDSRAVLESYSWPGNIRELRNVIERCVLLSAGPRVGVETLPMRVSGTGGATATANHQGYGPISLAELTERHIRNTVESASTLEEAARILDIDPATLYRRRKRYGLT